MSDISQNKIQVLIKLLDDPDILVYNEVEKKILEMGSSVIPTLEKAWESSDNSLLHSRIENIIQQIQFTEVYTGFSAWRQSLELNIVEGAFWVAKFIYPYLEMDRINTKLSSIILDLRNELNPSITPLGKIKVVNHILYDIHKFSRNVSNQSSPQNSCINEVLEIGRGNSVTLAIIYLTMGWAVGLPLVGVNLPINFIIGYLKPGAESLTRSKIKASDIEFYVNPTNYGAVLRTAEIDQFLKQQQIEKRNEYYLPCNNITIIKRLISTLILFYEQGPYDKLNKLNKLMDLL